MLQAAGMTIPLWRLPEVHSCAVSFLCKTDRSEDSLQLFLVDVAGKLAVERKDILNSA